MSEPNTGFILTRQQRELAGRTYLEYWLVTGQGPVRLLTDAQQAVFFVAQKDEKHVQQVLHGAGIHCQYKALSLKNFQHQAMAGLYFSASGAAYKAREVLQLANIVSYEDDIRMPERYLMERFITAGVSYSGQFLQCAGFAAYQKAKLKPAVFNPKFKVLSLDVECSEQGQLYSIGLAADDYQTVLMIGSAEKDAPNWIRWVENEKALLLALVEEVADYDPDIFVGWSVVNFDFRLLIKRATLHNIPLKLGRDKEVISWRDARGEVNQGFVSMAGRLVIDGIDALKTATYQFDSFSLESVSRQLLGKGKLSEDVDNRMAAINHDFAHNKVKLAEYNLQDCILVLEIFAHTRMLDFLTLRTQLTGLELDRSGGSVAAFVNLYLPKLHRAGYVAPNRPAGGGLASPGGYVMNSMPGLYRHVLVLDFKSLYPSIIRTFKIDPLGLIEGMLEADKAIPGYKGGLFSRDKHFLPEIITSLWQQRDEAKRNKDAPRSQAIKILMNSFYGVLGSGGCPFYDTRLASSITLRGHDIMQTTAAWIEEAGYKVIYGDTDSTFVWLDSDLSDQQAADIGRQLETIINRKWTSKIHADYQLENYLEIEFETHFSRFLMPTIRGSELGSKKRYAGLKVSKDGENLVFKGLETVRSDWTPLAKDFQHKLYALVFAGQDVESYLAQIIEDTRSGKFDQQLVYRKRLRQRLEKYVKNVPPHVKAARMADELNLQQGKHLRYQHKGTIAYVITVNGPEPLEYLSSAIDYEHYVEKQIRPIAEGILPFIGLSFEALTSQQMGLF